MQIVRGYQAVPESARGAVLAIGNFDGVHRGHQGLLAAVQEEARRRKRPAGVLVFEPHPREFFQPDKPHFRLTSLPLKLKLLDRFGVDVAVVLDFDEALASLPAESFVDRVLVRGLAVSHVVVGYDFRFGKGRGGDPDTLRRAGEAHGFGVTIVPQVAQAGEVFSSSAVRAELAMGDVAGAGQMLGHWWRIAGTVVGGAQRGAGLGYPTANIVLDPGTALAHGIYAVRVYAGTQAYQGAAYLGTRPTFDEGAPLLEVFLFDFEGDLYGRDLEVEFIGFIRADRRFPGPEALTAQMDRDCAQARDILARAPATPQIS